MKTCKTWYTNKTKTSSTTSKTQTQTQNTKQNLWKSMKTYKTWYTNTKHKRHTSSFLETVIQFCKENNCLYLSSRGAGGLYWPCSTCFFHIQFKRFFSLFFCFGVFFKRELYTAVSELVFFSFRLKDFFLN